MHKLARQSLRNRLTAIPIRRLIEPGVIGVFCTRALSAILAYTLFAVVGRATALDTYNEFALLFALVNFLGPIGSMGATSLVFKHWPALNSKGSRGKIEFLSSMTILVTFSGLAASGLAIALSLHGLGDKGNLHLYATISASVVTLALTELFFAVFRASHSVLVGVIIRELLWRLLFIGALCAAMLARILLSINEIAGLFLAVSLVTLIIFIASSKSYLSPSLLGRLDTKHLPPLSQIFTFFLLWLIAIAGVHLDTLILSVRGPSIELGAFFSAQRTIQVLYLFSQSIGTFAAPIVAAEFAASNTQSITRQSRLAAAGGLLVTLPAALAVISMSDTVLGFFRPEFAAYWPIVAALSAGPLIYTVFGYHVIIPMYCGEEKRYLLGRVLLLTTFIPIKLLAGLYSDLTVYSIISSVEVICASAYGAIVASRYCRIPAI